jgi:hypothetical protein
MTESRDNKSNTDLAKHLATDLRSSEAVRALLYDSLPAVVVIISSALALGREDITLEGDHNVQAALKGRALKQFGQELDELIKKGKVRADYAETKYGFRSLVELMKTIDGDATDEEWLRAAKTMFVALNSTSTPQNEEALRYQLFRLVLKLTAAQLAIVSACRLVGQRQTLGSNNSGPASQWPSAVGDIIGHHVVPLIEQDETQLVNYGVLFGRTYSDRSGVTQTNNGCLTAFGVKIAELLEKYDDENISVSLSPGWG